MPSGKGGKEMFHLGTCVITPGAQGAFEMAGERLVGYLRRHQSGDWGDMPPEDVAENNRCLNPECPCRVMSSYTLKDGEKIWIITEWDRSVTTILLPEEY